MIVALLMVFVAGLVLMGGNDRGTPYDLDDPGPDGYKGLRLVLERLGAEVDEGDSSEIDVGLARSGTVVYVPVATAIPHEQTRRWEDFVRSGGRLVLGTPRDDGGPQPTEDPSGGVIVGSPPGICDIDELADLEAIDPSGFQRLEVPAGERSCYGDGEVALIVQQMIGEGTLTTLASPRLLINDALRARNQEVDDPKGPMRDNVVVAARLFAPDGQGRVLVITSGVAAAELGEESILSLIGPSVKLGLWQLVIAFALFAWWRGRRHGRVVTETQPVPIAGSELVAAVGNLMSRRHDPRHAATLLRTAAVRDLAERLGVPRGTDVTVVAELIAARTGRDPAAVLGPLASTPVSTDGDLLAVAAHLEAIRTEVLHGRSSPAALGTRSDPGAP